MRWLVVDCFGERSGIGRVVAYSQKIKSDPYSAFCLDSAIRIVRNTRNEIAESFSVTDPLALQLRCG
jgi:hypothetical protein